MPSEIPTTNDLIEEFLPIAMAETCRMIARNPEFSYLSDDLKGEAALRLVEILQPERVKWDENKDSSKNLAKINVFIRIAIMRRCIDLFRKEGLRADTVRSRSDISNLALCTSEAACMDALTDDEALLVGRLLDGEEPDRIAESGKWDTKEQITEALESIRFKLSTRPAAKT